MNIDDSRKTLNIDNKIICTYEMFAYGSPYYKTIAINCHKDYNEDFLIQQISLIENRTFETAVYLNLE